jgi:hypothetical protein
MRKFLLFLLLSFIVTTVTPAQAHWSAPYRKGLCDGRNECTKVSYDESKKTIKHITDEFIKHREWMIKTFWEQYLLPALMLMAEQLTAAAMQQVQIIGTFFDAKHQLATQRLFNEMTAQAHKDYHPSEGLCTIGTGVRSLAASDRNTEVTSEILAARNVARQSLQGDAISSEHDFSDRQSRFAQFVKTYCNPKDNANGLDLLCGTDSTNRRPNKDINFTETFDAPMTLDVDYTDGFATSKDEEDIFALGANLYGHEVPPVVSKINLTVDDKGIPSTGANLYQDIRALMAKRSVAHNSFAEIVAQKAMGEKEVQPYLKALLKEMGIPDDDITLMLGERPSYYAQMEILTKKIYQNPNFYTDLYDKPANVKRKEVAMQAIDLMQKRDMFRSLLRSEANLSVMLETVLAEQQDMIKNETSPGGN